MKINEKNYEGQSLGEFLKSKKMSNYFINFHIIPMVAAIWSMPPEMAQKIMTEIANDVKKRWPINEIAIHHRIGRLEIGETSVAIAVSAPHRADGIEACHYAIDRLKTIVPIWKKEFWIDGEHWVEGSLNPKTEAKPSPKPTDTAD